MCVCFGRCWVFVSAHTVIACAFKTTEKVPSKHEPLRATHL